MASNSFSLFVTYFFLFLKKFKKTLVILHFFAPCEIMCLTNGFMEFKKEFAYCKF